MQHVQVIPGPWVFENNIPFILNRAKQVEGLVEWVQIDIADGILVPGKTPLDPMLYQLLFDLDLKYELHMMVQNPLTTSDAWVAMGVTRLLWHIESEEISTLKSQNSNLQLKIQRYQNQGVEIGLAVDKQTPVEALFPWLDRLDCVLIMTIQAGFSGQEFLPSLLDKVRAIRSRMEHLPIEVDGGINFSTALQAIQAGASRLAATSSIFQSADVSNAIRTLGRI